MSRLEDELRRALGREDPGPEFTARVLARTAANRREERASFWPAVRRLFSPARVRWATAGAVACVLAVGGIAYRERQTRIEGERAKERLILALRIAGEKLSFAREKVQELNAAGSHGE